MPDPASRTVGTQVRRRREQRGITSAELARRAGISKANLSGIESGRGNPTLETMNALALALAIPLTDLLTTQGEQLTEVLPARPDTTATGPQQDLLRRIPTGHGVELWRLRLGPGQNHDGVPHTAGTTEHLLLVAGSLTAGPTGDERTIAPGDLLTFSGEQPHHYQAGPDGADVHVVIATPH